MAATEETIQLVTIAAQAAADKLAVDPVAIDVSERLYFAEVFLICSAPTDRQARAICENIDDELRRQVDVHPQRLEGRAEGKWILMDYGDFVCHVLTDEDREFYSLETLWGDRPRIPLELEEAKAVNYSQDSVADPRDIAAGYQPGDGPAE